MILLSRKEWKQPNSIVIDLVTKIGMHASTCHEHNFSEGFEFYNILVHIPALTHGFLYFIIIFIFTTINIYYTMIYTFYL
jgi:hypothetical protein